MSADTEPVTLIATFRAIEGQDSKVLSLIGEYGLAVRAEPGNIFFDIYTEHDDDHAFVIVERYSNQHAFDQHLAGDEGKVLTNNWPPWWKGKAPSFSFFGSPLSSAWRLGGNERPSRYFPHTFPTSHRTGSAQQSEYLRLAALET